MNVIKSTKTKLGNNIELIGESGDNNVLIIGVFHGDEPQGKLLIEEYLKKHSPNNLLFIPCLNPDGLSTNTRTNSNGVDLNRNFPTQNWGKMKGITQPVMIAQRPIMEENHRQAKLKHNL